MIQKCKDGTTWAYTPHVKNTIRKLNSCGVKALNVLDTESTGLKADDRVIQVSFIHFVHQRNEYVPAWYFDSYVSQPRLISKEASEVNGITNEMLEKAPKQNEIFPKLKKSLGDTAGTLLVAYNGGFDIKKLDLMWHEEEGTSFPYSKDEAIDVMRIAQEVIPRSALIGIGGSDKGSYKQTNVCELLGIDTAGAHNSLKDVELTATLLGRLLELYKKAWRDEKSLEKLAIIDIKHEKYAHDKDYYHIKTKRGVISYNSYDGRFTSKTAGLIEGCDMDTLSAEYFTRIGGGV